MKFKVLLKTQRIALILATQDAESIPVIIFLGSYRNEPLTVKCPSHLHDFSQKVSVTVL